MPVLSKLNERLREEIEQSPLFYITLAFVMLLVLFFRAVIELLLQGLVFAALALLVLVLAFLVWVRAGSGKAPVRELLAKKGRIVDEIEIARKRFLQRKLGQKDFNEIFAEKQQVLIETEALIQQSLDREEKQAIEEEVKGVEARKRHFLRIFLFEKKRLLKELSIAEKSYLKRKIDAATYKGLVKKDRKRLIEIDAEINALHRQGKVSEVMLNLKKGLGSVEKSREEEYSKAAHSIVEQNRAMKKEKVIEDLLEQEGKQ